MNILELALFLCILGAGLWGGRSLYVRYGLLIGITGGLSIVAAIVGGLALLEKLFPFRPNSQ